MAADLELHVRTESLQGDLRLRFELHAWGGTARYTRHRIAETVQISVGSVESFANERIRRFQSLDSPAFVARTAPGGLAHELRVLGQELYRELFPVTLRNTYSDFRTKIRTLLLVSDEPWIPWELAKPYGEDFEDDFLCCQFEMVRWLAGETAPAARFGEEQIGLTRLAVVEAGDAPGVTELKQAAAERSLLEELSHRHGGVEATLLPKASHPEVLELLRQGGHGLLHFVGHGAFRERDPNASPFALADGRLFSPRDLDAKIENQMRKDRPLVFFNSCQAARQAPHLTQLAGWVPRWILDCGCGAFLGPLWDVNDAQAALFTKFFYTAAEAGETLAAAAQKARLEVREQFQQGTGWLAFAVYAHPEARLRLGLAPTPLWIPESRWRPDVSPPGALLRAEHGVVPFHGRETELGSLTAWCAEGSSVAVRLYTGAGGMGKTRLALELCKRLRAEGWEAGLYADEGEPGRPFAEEFQAILARERPVLAVVDYAERRRDLIVSLAREMDRLERGKVRVILLARAALGWWDALQKEGDGVGDFLAGPAARWWTLQPLANGIEEREASYRAALKAFASHLHKPAPECEPPDLKADFYKQILYVHMQALAAVDERPLKERDDILDYILRREKRFWEKLAAEREVAPPLAHGIGRAMALFNMWGGARDEGHAIECLGKLRHFADQPVAVRAQVAYLLRDTYPGERWIMPMLPDLLGEHHTRREMQQDSSEFLDLIGPPPPPAQ